MKFKMTNFDRAEFFVCLNAHQGEQHYQVPVDTSVQAALKDMLDATLSQIEELKKSEGFEEFSPVQKYSANDAVYCKMDSAYAEIPRQLLGEKEIPETSHAIDDLAQISFYYVIAYDLDGNKLLGVRRASQFKGVLKSKLLKVVDNTLKLLSDRTFRLDSEFDYIADKDMLWALRPSGLEFTGQLTEAVMAMAVQSSVEISKRVSFLDLHKLGSYASKHPRAARYLAAVRSRSDLEKISQTLLTSYCSNANVGLVEKDGKLSPAEGQEILFLEVLDRRVFTAELIEGEKERYEAPNRRNV
jgi:hypothetical protein